MFADLIMMFIVIRFLRNDSINLKGGASPETKIEHILWPYSK